MQQITDHLYRFEDSCSVYLVRDGDRGLLIDCGTRLAPEALAEAGVSQVERLLLSHFHRDQCSAATEWQRRGAEVAIPFTEKRFFEEAPLLRASYDIFDNYDSYYPTFGPLEAIQPDLYAYDYIHLPWRGIDFEVVPLPGHTFGSVGYLFEVDSQRVLACGDMMASPGKLQAYYPVQWSYMEFKGHANLLESLQAVAALQVDLLLPGHGQPFAPTDQAIGVLQRHLERLYELFYARPYVYFKPEFRQVTPHVIEVTNSGANTYIIKDDGGHALFIDCGYTATAPINANPHRVIDNLTPYLEPELGITAVEWFMPSHYHDDHLAGYPALKNRYGTKFVTCPELKDIVEHPERYDMPCLVPQGDRVDRVVGRGEPFAWRGIEFFIDQHPGQTLYHNLIRFEVDGKKFLCIGDNLSGLSFSEHRDYIHSFIPKNRTPVTSYRDMPAQALDASPDFLLTGHGGAVAYERPTVERWQAWMDEWQAIFTDIIDQPTPNLGMDPRWVEFYPYKVRVAPGDQLSLRLKVKNHEGQARAGTVKFRSAAGVVFSPAEAALAVPGGGSAEIEVQVTFPPETPAYGWTVLADVTWNGQYLGEIAEAIAYL